MPETVIIKGIFKDGKGFFYISKDACKHDSLCRTTVIENATIFKNDQEATKFLNKLRKNCERCKEVRFFIEEIETNFDGSIPS